MADYFVDTINGNDTTGDGSSGAPFKSLLKAWSNTSAAAEHNTIYCSGGLDPLPNDQYLGYHNLTSTSGITVVGDFSGMNPGGHTGYVLLSKPQGDLRAIAFYAHPTAPLVELKNLYVRANIARTIPGANNFEGLLNVYNTTGPTYLNVDSCVFEYTAPQALAGGSYSHGNVVLRTDPRGYLANCFFISTGELTESIFGLNYVYLQSPEYGNFYTINCFLRTEISPGVFTGRAGFLGGGSTSREIAAYNCISITDPSGPSVNGYTSFSGLGLTKGCIYTGGLVGSWNGPVEDTIRDTNVTTYYKDVFAHDYTPIDPNVAPINLAGLGFARPNQTTVDITGFPRPAIPEDTQGWDCGPYEYAPRSPHPGVIEVDDISQANDPNCIYYGQQIELGDKVSYSTSTETNGWSVDIDGQGYPIIDPSGGSGVDSFVFNISRGGGLDWEPEPPGVYTWLFSVQPTLSNPTTSAPTPTSTMISVTTNSTSGTLYAAVRTAAQGGAYTEGDQEVIRDATVGGDCVWKGNIVGPMLGVNQFEVTGLSLGTEYFYGFAQDAVSTS